MATEQKNVTNATVNSQPEFFSSPMPAWVPAVTVATGMMIFLAASFYLRHRKVLKKRQILMDYFYIIFQYGGVRRKRMVAALCNTNSITLRQLGRSFMISFDSIANNDNSCPFFMDDTAFSNHNSYTPQRKTLFRSKSRTAGSRLRPPMRSPSPTAHANHRQQNQSGFQEIRMKFKSRKSPTASPDASSRLMPPRLGSLCSIHDDDPAAHILYHENHENESRHAQERRNAYILSYDSSGSVIMEEEFEKPTIPNAVLERLQQHSSCGKRNSEPIYYEGGYNPYPNAHLKVMPDEGTKIYGTRVLYPSTDRIDANSDNGALYRNSEPTIMIHSASNDFGSSFELEDLQSQCSNGLVFVKKVTTDDGNVERYYINERPAQGFNQRHRASLSKVSYVPSGNMNDYYHSCLQSPKKKKTETHQNSQDSGSTDAKSDEKSKSGWSWKKSGSKKTSEIEVPTPSAGRRGRLSIGDIAVSNFNRRIVDFPSESMGSTYDSDIEIPSKQMSRDHSQSKPASTWTRLKNVFSGSRSSQTSVTKMKQTKFTQSEDRGKRGGKRVHGKWRRFVGGLMGFGTMSEQRRAHKSSLKSKNSKSLPTGLDHQMTSTDEFIFRRNSHAVSLDSQSVYRMNRSTENQPFFGKIRNRIIPPSPLRAPPKTQSFPDGMLNMEHSFDKTHSICPFPRSPRRSVISLRTNGNKVKRKYSSCDTHSYSRARSNSDAQRNFLHHQTSSQSSCDDPYFKQYQNLSAVSSPRSKSPVYAVPNDYEGLSFYTLDKRSRSPSPLPERRFKAGPQRKSSLLFSNCEKRSLSEKEKSFFPHFANSTDFALPLSLIGNHLYNDRVCGKHNKNTSYRHFSDKDLNKHRQFSTGHIDDIEKGSKTLEVHHLRTEHGSLKHRHSISGPTCNGSTINGMQAHSHGSGLDTGRPSLGNKQTLNLDVDAKLFGTSVESVYFDTVSVLGSPSTSLTQNTTPSSPLNQTDHCVLEMTTTEKDITSANSRENNLPATKLDVLPMSQDNETKVLKGFGDRLVECQTALVPPSDAPADAIASQTTPHPQELPLLKKKGDSDSSPVSSTPLCSTSPPPSNPSSALSRTQCVPLDLKLSQMESSSIEHQNSPSSSINKSNEKDLAEDSPQKSLGPKVDGDDNGKSSPPLNGYQSTPLLSPPDLESNASSLKTTSKDIPLPLPSQTGTTFHIVSETHRTNSPEEVAIFNLTRLPRFGRRPSQCTPSPLSEGRPGSGASTPIQMNATTMTSCHRNSTP